MGGIFMIAVFIGVMAVLMMGVEKIGIDSEKFIIFVFFGGPILWVIYMTLSHM